MEAGQLRFAWVIGTTWLQAMAASGELAAAFRRRTRESPHQIAAATREAAVAALTARVDAGGMVVIDQDIYLPELIGSEFADLVLPAAGWGESDFARCNGERRLRLYSKICDPPGEAQPDWWIVSRFAQRMGFEGYDWNEPNDVFEQAARFGRKDILNYHPLVVYARWLGGARARDIMLTLASGMAGTPMPSYLESGLTTDELWSLAHYVESLVGERSAGSE